ncbi:MAG: hypothetical protein AAF193_08355, partial [Bacteroidota bacterium]
MKPIDKIISGLTRKQFAAFEKQLRDRKGRKGVLDVELIRALRTSGFNKEHFIQSKYGKFNSASLDKYHALRIRVTNHLLSFLATQQEGVRELEMEVMENIHASRGLMKIGELEWAGQLLDKASRIADKHDLHFMKSWILHEKMISSTRINFNLDQLEKSSSDVNQQIELDQRMQMGQSMLFREIRARKSKGTAVEPLGILHQVVEKYDLDQESLEDPSTAHQLCVMFRKVLVANKEFPELLEFLLDVKNRIDQVEHKSPTAYQHAEMMYMLAHAHYRCRNYSEALKHIKHLYAAIQNLDKMEHERWFRKGVLLEGQVRSFSGELKSAIQLLQEMMGHSSFKNAQIDKCTLTLNLAVLYFQSGFFSEVLKILDELRRRDSWYSENMGFEWMLKKKMIELITLVELEELDSAQKRIDTIRSYESAFFMQKPYRRILKFLEMIELYMEDKDRWTQKFA